MNTVRMALVVGVLVAVGGCDADKTPPPIAPQSSATPQSATPANSGGVIPQAQLDTLNKAKAVEGTLMQADQKRQEQIDR